MAVSAEIIAKLAKKALPGFTVLATAAAFPELTLPSLISDREKTESPRSRMD